MQENRPQISKKSSWTATRQIRTLRSLERDFRRYADRLAPQWGRCLLTLERDPAASIEYAHLISIFTKHREAMCLEWSWGLAPNGLQLDIPENLLVLMADMHCSLRANEWALLPAHDVVKRLLDYSLTHIEGTNKQPHLITSIYNGATEFAYSLLPLRGMEHNHIHRIHNLQEVEGFDDPETREYVHHHHPFADFPPMMSHVYPHFVVYNTSEKLIQLPPADILYLATEHGPIITDILRLRGIWSDVQLPATGEFRVTDKDADQPGFRVRIDRPSKPAAAEKKRKRSRAPSPPPSPREEIRRRQEQLRRREQMLAEREEDSDDEPEASELGQPDSDESW